MRQRLFFSLALAGLATAVLLVTRPSVQGHAFGVAAVSQAEGVTIAVEPGTKSAMLGDVFTLDVRVDAGTQSVDAVDVFLNFGPMVLQVVDASGNPATKATPGTALKRELQNRVDNSAGRIDISMGKGPTDPLATGSFVVASVRFKGVAVGDSPVTFSLTSPRRTAVYFVGTNLLGSANPGSVIVSAPATATASPTASPTATTAPPPSGGGGGSSSGGSGGSATATATPSSTPGPAAAAPAIAGPEEGATALDMAPLLTWVNPPGTTQYQVQVLPAPNAFTGTPDGPGINLIIGDPALVQQARFQVEAPQLGTGNYVLLPGMTYTWRVRTATAAAALGPDDPRWGPWSSRTFRTPPPSSAALSVVAPLEGSTVASLTPTLQWTGSDARIFYYEVQVSRDPTFTTDPAAATAMVYWELRHGGATSPLNSYTIPAAFPLERAATYYWRVRPRVQGDGTPAAWSPNWTFRSAE